MSVIAPLDQPDSIQDLVDLTLKVVDNDAIFKYIISLIQKEYKSELETADNDLKLWIVKSHMPWALERSGILEAAVQTTGLEDVLFRVIEQANEALLQHKTLHSRLDLVIEEYKSIQIEAFGRIHSLMDDSPIDLVSDEEEDLSIIEKQSSDELKDPKNWKTLQPQELIVGFNGRVGQSVLFRKAPCVWCPGYVLSISRSTETIVISEDGDPESNNQKRNSEVEKLPVKQQNKLSKILYKVRLLNSTESSGENDYHDDEDMVVDASSLALTKSASDWKQKFPVGARVVTIDREGGAVRYYSGLVAEPPSERNKQRYLLFLDDGYTQYSPSNEIFRIFHQSKENWREATEDSRDFIRRYLAQYPQRPMVRLKPGQQICTELNGQWLLASVSEVDASLALIRFPTRHSEWLYRGSMRFEPLYNELMVPRTQISGGASRTVLDHGNRVDASLKDAAKKPCARKSATGAHQTQTTALAGGVRCFSMACNGVEVVQTATATDDTGVGSSSTSSVKGDNFLAGGPLESIPVPAGPPSRGRRRTRHTGGQVAPVPVVNASISDIGQLQQHHHHKHHGHSRHHPRRGHQPGPHTQLTRHQLLDQPLPAGVVSLNLPPAASEVKSDEMAGSLVPYLDSLFRGRPIPVYDEHKCCEDCLKSLKDPTTPSSGNRSERPLDYLGLNPIEIPFHAGWFRCISYARPPDLSRDVITYITPCGRRLRSLHEVERFLDLTDSQLTPDLFSFDPSLRINQDFRAEKVITRIEDLSYRKENVPVQCVNSVDGEVPGYIDYTPRRQPAGIVPLDQTTAETGFLVCCDCTDNCRDRSKCACQQLTVEASSLTNPSGQVDHQAGYRHRRLNQFTVGGIYECNSRCQCDRRCGNRVVQQGVWVRMQVFKTERKGWGIRALHAIPKGTFLCIYAGAIYNEETAVKEGHDYGDEYQADLDYIETIEKSKEGYESFVDEPSDSEEKQRRELLEKDILGGKCSAVATALLINGQCDVTSNSNGVEVSTNVIDSLNAGINSPEESGSGRIYEQRSFDRMLNVLTRTGSPGLDSCVPTKPKEDIKIEPCGQSDCRLDMASNDNLKQEAIELKPLVVSLTALPASALPHYSLGVRLQPNAAVHSGRASASSPSSLNSRLKHAETTTDDVISVSSGTSSCVCISNINSSASSSSSSGHFSRCGSTHSLVVGPDGDIVGTPSDSSVSILSGSTAAGSNISGSDSSSSSSSGGISIAGQDVFCSVSQEACSLFSESSIDSPSSPRAKGEERHGDVDMLGTEEEEIDKITFIALQESVQDNGFSYSAEIDALAISTTKECNAPACLSELDSKVDKLSSEDIASKCCPSSQIESQREADSDRNSVKDDEISSRISSEQIGKVPTVDPGSKNTSQDLGLIKFSPAAQSPLAEIMTDDLNEDKVIDQIVTPILAGSNIEYIYADPILKPSSSCVSLYTTPPPTPASEMTLDPDPIEPLQLTSKRFFNSARKSLRPRCSLMHSCPGCGSWTADRDGALPNRLVQKYDNIFVPEAAETDSASSSNSQALKIRSKESPNDVEKLLSLGLPPGINQPFRNLQEILTLADFEKIPVVSLTPLSDLQNLLCNRSAPEGKESKNKHRKKNRKDKKKKRKRRGFCQDLVSTIDSPLTDCSGDPEHMFGHCVPVAANSQSVSLKLTIRLGARRSTTRDADGSVYDDNVGTRVRQASAPQSSSSSPSLITDSSRPRSVSAVPADGVPIHSDHSKSLVSSRHKANPSDKASHSISGRRRRRFRQSARSASVDATYSKESRARTLRSCNGRETSLPPTTSGSSQPELTKNNLPSRPHHDRVHRHNRHRSSRSTAGTKIDGATSAPPEVTEQAQPQSIVQRSTLAQSTSEKHRKNRTTRSQSAYLMPCTARRHRHRGHHPYLHSHCKHHHCRHHIKNQCQHLQHKQQHKYEKARQQIHQAGCEAGCGVRESVLVGSTGRRQFYPVRQPDWLRARRYFNDHHPYIMDAKKIGNLGRYFNHSCNPNVFVQNVFITSHDPRFPEVAFFAARNIEAGEEMTWDYGYTVDQVPFKVLYCYCGEPNCRKRLL